MLYKLNNHVAQDEGNRHVRNCDQYWTSSIKNKKDERLLSNFDDINVDLVHSFLQDKLCERPASIVPNLNTILSSNYKMENLPSANDLSKRQQSDKLIPGAPS